MNWDHILSLLMVADYARDYPTLKPLHDLALTELQELNDQPEQERDQWQETSSPSTAPKVPPHSSPEQVAAERRRLETSTTTPRP